MFIKTIIEEAELELKIIDNNIIWNHQENPVCLASGMNW
jgi:hypothetical protein